MHFRVAVQKLRTDGRGAFQYLPSRAFGAEGDKNCDERTVGQLFSLQVWKMKSTAWHDRHSLKCLYMTGVPIWHDMTLIQVSLIIDEIFIPSVHTVIR